MNTKICTKCKEEKPINVFSTDVRNKDRLTSWCLQCLNISSKTYKKAKGYGVYIAVYKSGKYIGSGQLQECENDHKTHTSSARYVLPKEPCLSFAVLIRCHKTRKLELEQALISWVGIENLLNVRNVTPQHGGTTKYNNGCRCSACKKAWSTYSRLLYKRRKTKIKMSNEKEVHSP